MKFSKNILETLVQRAYTVSALVAMPGVPVGTVGHIIDVSTSDGAPDMILIALG